MITTVRAWLLNLHPSFALAVAEHEQIEVLSAPRRFAMPLTPKHCNEVIFWRGQLIPLFRLDRLVFDSGLAVSNDPVKYCAVMAYQIAPGNPLAYAAMSLIEPPRSIEVDDQMMQGPEAVPSVLYPALLSCFRFEESTLAVLDLAKIFAFPDAFSRLETPATRSFESHQLN